MYNKIRKKMNQFKGGPKTNKHTKKVSAPVAVPGVIVLPVVRGNSKSGLDLLKKMTMTLADKGHKDHTNEAKGSPEKKNNAKAAAKMKDVMVIPDVPKSDGFVGKVVDATTVLPDRAGAPGK